MIGRLLYPGAITQEMTFTGAATIQNQQPCARIASDFIICHKSVVEALFLGVTHAGQYANCGVGNGSEDKDLALA